MLSDYQNNTRLVSHVGVSTGSDALDGLAGSSVFFTEVPGKLPLSLAFSRLPGTSSGVAG
jgi:hypothetical protein